MYVNTNVTGCGHCKKAKPEFGNAAGQFSDDTKVCAHYYNIQIWIIVNMNNDHKPSSRCYIINQHIFVPIFLQWCTK